MRQPCTESDVNVRARAPESERQSPCGLARVGRLSRASRARSLTVASSVPAAVTSLQLDIPTVWIDTARKPRDSADGAHSQVPRAQSHDAENASGRELRRTYGTRVAPSIARANLLLHCIPAAPTKGPCGPASAAHQTASTMFAPTRNTAVPLARLEPYAKESDSLPKRAKVRDVSCRAIRRST